MNKFKEMIGKFIKEEDGTTAVEYGVMLAFIAVGVIVAVTALKDAVAGKMNDAATRITSAP
jgi:pilus assembly protein Flp/PilA